MVSGEGEITNFRAIPNKQLFQLFAQRMKREKPDSIVVSSLFPNVFHLTPNYSNFNALHPPSVAITKVSFTCKAFAKKNYSRKLLVQ